MSKSAIYVCQTPLHVLEASIIANKNRKKYSHQSLVITDKKIPKGINQCLHFYSWDKVIITIPFSSKIYKLFILLFASFRNKFSRINKSLDFYCGNLSSSYTHLQLLNYKPGNIYTFDDGVFNLTLKKNKLVEIRDGKSVKYIKKIFKIDLGLKKLLNLVEAHYTIFKIDFNISLYKKIIYINEELKKLLSSRNIKKIDEVWVIVQPYYEDGIMSLEQQLNIYKYIVKDQGNCDVKLKLHPRNERKFYEQFGVNILDSDLPLELLLMYFQPKKIVGIDSTGLITSKIINNDIEVVSYLINNNNEKKEEFEKYNIKCIIINEENMIPD